MVYRFEPEQEYKWKFPGVQADAINFGVTNNILAVGNYVVGGEDSSSCGINVDYKGNNSTIRNNILLNNFHCGIGVGSGTSVVSYNKVLLLQPSSPNAGGITIANFYPPNPCGPVTLTNNISYGTQSTGYVQGFWGGGNCPVDMCRDYGAAGPVR
jgi:hypothetical protein